MSSVFVTAASNRSSSGWYSESDRNHTRTSVSARYPFGVATCPPILASGDRAISVVWRSLSPRIVPSGPGTTRLACPSASTRIPPNATRRLCVRST